MEQRIPAIEPALFLACPLLGTVPSVGLVRPPCVECYQKLKKNCTRYPLLGVPVCCPIGSSVGACPALRRLAAERGFETGTIFAWHKISVEGINQLRCNLPRRIPIRCSQASPPTRSAFISHYIAMILPSTQIIHLTINLAGLSCL